MPDEILLNYLGRGYFHQDYDLEADTPTDLVRKFASHDSLDYVKIMERELREIMTSGITEGEARVLWMVDAHSMYDPKRDGKSYLSWLQEILEIVQEEIAKRVESGEE